MKVPTTGSKPGPRRQGLRQRRGSRGGGGGDSCAIRLQMGEQPHSDRMKFPHHIAIERAAHELRNRRRKISSVWHVHCAASLYPCAYHDAPQSRGANRRNAARKRRDHFFAARSASSRPGHRSFPGRVERRGDIPRRRIAAKRHSSLGCNWMLTPRSSEMTVINGWYGGLSPADSTTSGSLEGRFLQLSHSRPVSVLTPIADSASTISANVLAWSIFHWPGPSLAVQPCRKARSCSAARRAAMTVMRLAHWDSATRTTPRLGADPHIGQPHQSLARSLGSAQQELGEPRCSIG